MEENALPASESMAAFARRLGFKRSYITQLRKDQRLVMTDDGKKVRVAESIALIESSKDPSKRAVAARHAAKRAADPVPAADPLPEPPEPDPASASYQHHRATREEYLAKAAIRDYELSIRKLMPAADVETALAQAITELRARLERLPFKLASQVAAESDETRCMRILADEIEPGLSELARVFGDLAAQEETT